MMRGIMRNQDQCTNHTADRAQAELRRQASPGKALIAQRYFKTGPGEYAEGDIFLGMTAAVFRSIARQFRGMPLAEIAKMIRSEVHEDRSLALFLLVDSFASADEVGQKRLVDFYLKNLRFVNNWDLVDGSAPNLLGAYCFLHDKDILFRLVSSPRLWDRRVAVLSTLYFIRLGSFHDTLKMAETLLHDKEDLMHKAVGWMLREIGKRNERILEGFLDKHTTAMPRTMLRYAIERMPEKKRQAYLKKRP
jgi:3-methyladenine DNA glycosylase AlkD